MIHKLIRAIVAQPRDLWHKTGPRHALKLRRLERTAQEELAARQRARQSGIPSESPAAAPRRLERLFIRTIGNDVAVRSHSTDILVIDEVFFREVYACAVAAAPPRTRYVLDIGANAGYAGLYFLNRFPHARLFFVEPDFQNFAVAAINLQKEILAGRCRGINAAAWVDDGHVVLETQGRGEWFFKCREAAPEENALEAFSIASLIRRSGFPHVDLLKIDIEGSERAILQGELSPWIDLVRCLVCELHEGFTHAEFEELLAPHGFRCSRSLNLSVAMRPEEATEIERFARRPEPGVRIL
jgi:FkbM family methyltransferase